MTKPWKVIACALLSLCLTAPAQAHSRHWTVSKLVQQAGTNPHACDIPPYHQYGPKQVECIIRVVWPQAIEDEAVSVAKCESNLNPRERSTISTASGVFQFLDGTWRTTPQWLHAYRDARKNGHSVARSWQFAAARVFDPVANSRGARWLYRTGGKWRQWVCKPGWR